MRLLPMAVLATFSWYLVAYPPAGAAAEEPASFSRILSLQEAIDLALAQNLELQAASARVEAISTLTAQVRSQWLPRVVAYGVYMHLDHETTADFTSSLEPLLGYFEGLGPVLQNLGLDPPPSLQFEPLIIQHQEDYRAGGSVSVQFEPRTLVQYDSADLALEQGQHMLDQGRIRLGQGITELYYGLVTLREMQAVANRNVETRRLSLENVQSRFNLGMTIELDVLRAQLSLSEAVNQVEQLGSAFEDLRTQTAMLLQTDPDFDVALPPSPPTFSDPAEVIQAAMEHHPQVVSARVALELAQNASREVAWSWAPIFDAAFNLNLARATAFSDENLRWDVTLKLVWPLFLGGIRLAQRDQRAAEEMAADHSLRQALAQIRSDIQRAFLQRRQLESDLELAQQQLQLAEQAHRLAQAVYNQGVGTQLDLMEAETRLFAVQTRVVQTELALARQNAHIYSLTGRIWRP
ncbi:MAG: TolC family protein [Bradymonadales bacterium]|nr:TolC family protein [Bradymonadales bacterium]